MVVKSHQLGPVASTETYTVLTAVFAASVVVTGLLVPWSRQRLGLGDYHCSANAPRRGQAGSRRPPRFGVGALVMAARRLPAHVVI